VKILQNDKPPSNKKKGQSGNKINNGRGKKGSHFGRFSERMLKGKRSSEYIRNYKTAYLFG